MNENNKKIILIGNGWAGSSFLKTIDYDKFEVEVISKNKYFIFTPLLVRSLFNKMINIRYDVNKFGKFKFKNDEVKSVDFDKNLIILENSDLKLDYDYLVLAHGSDINTFNINGVKENCHFLNYSNSDNIKKKLDELNDNSNIMVIGCGLSGSELIGNLIDQKKFKNIYAIDGLKYPLPQFNQKLRNYTLNLWNLSNVNTCFGNFVNKIDKNKIYFKNNSLNYDIAFWCGGVKPSKFSMDINKKLLLNCKYGIPVDDYLKVKNTNNVFAIGDCSFNKLQPTAQVAYQEGKYLAYNFNNNFKNINKFKFINRGKLCYIGNNKSIFENKYLSFKGTLFNYFNKMIHIYNGINLDQKIQLFNDLYL